MFAAIGELHMAFWDRVRELDGRTLYTSEQNKPFDIVEVTHDRIYFVPQEGNGTRRWWPRQSLEDLNELFANESAITPAHIRDQWPKDQNTSYVAVILQTVRN
jgi:hypothetical protein